MNREEAKKERAKLNPDFNKECLFWTFDIEVTKKMTCVNFKNDYFNDSKFIVIEDKDYPVAFGTDPKTNIFERIKRVQKKLILENGGTENDVKRYKPIFNGQNNFFYDNPMVNQFIKEVNKRRMSTAEIVKMAKDLNDYHFHPDRKKERKPWPTRTLQYNIMDETGKPKKQYLPSVDLMYLTASDISEMVGLKSLQLFNGDNIDEGNLKEILEKDNLTQQDRENLIDYCNNDVDSTIKFTNKRGMDTYLAMLNIIDLIVENKIERGEWSEWKRYNHDLIGKKLSPLVNYLLSDEMEQYAQGKYRSITDRLNNDVWKQELLDEMNTKITIKDFPQSITTNPYLMKLANEYIGYTLFELGAYPGANKILEQDKTGFIKKGLKGKHVDELRKKGHELTPKVVGFFINNSSFGLGGVHGVNVDQTLFENIRLWDVTSFYPSAIVAYLACRPHNLNIELYKKMLNDRIVLKHAAGEKFKKANGIQKKLDSQKLTELKVIISKKGWLSETELLNVKTIPQLESMLHESRMLEAIETFDETIGSDETRIALTQEMNVLIKKATAELLTATVYKLALNMTFGNTRDGSLNSSLFDPKAGLMICVTCQILMQKLDQMLRKEGAIIVQTNTDGIAFTFPKNCSPEQKERIEAVKERWESDLLKDQPAGTIKPVIRLEREQNTDGILAIQKDVNNYILKDTRTNRILKGVGTESKSTFKEPGKNNSGIAFLMFIGSLEGKDPIDVFKDPNNLNNLNLYQYSFRVTKEAIGLEFIPEKRVAELTDDPIAQKKLLTMLEEEKNKANPNINRVFATHSAYPGSWVRVMNQNTPKNQKDRVDLDKKIKEIDQKYKLISSKRIEGENGEIIFERIHEKELPKGIKKTYDANVAKLDILSRPILRKIQSGLRKQTIYNGDLNALTTPIHLLTKSQEPDDVVRSKKNAIREKKEKERVEKLHAFWQDLDYKHYYAEFKNIEKKWNKRNTTVDLQMEKDKVLPKYIYDKSSTPPTFGSFEEVDEIFNEFFNEEDIAKIPAQLEMLEHKSLKILNNEIKELRERDNGSKKTLKSIDKLEQNVQDVLELIKTNEDLLPTLPDIAQPHLQKVHKRLEENKKIIDFIRGKYEELVKRSTTGEIFRKQEFNDLKPFISKLLKDYDDSVTDLLNDKLKEKVEESIKNPNKTRINSHKALKDQYKSELKSAFKEYGISLTSSLYKQMVGTAEKTLDESEVKLEKLIDQLENKGGSDYPPKGKSGQINF